MTWEMGSAAAGGALDARLEALRARPAPFLFETALAPPGEASVSIAGADPVVLLTARGRDVRQWESGNERSIGGSPWDAARELVARVETEWPDAHVVGFLGYDLGRWLERLPARAADDQRFPDLLLGVYDRVTRLDHRSGRVEESAPAHDAPRAVDAEALQAAFDDPPPAVGANFDRETYLAAVARAREHILDGDIYQVNLSQRFAARSADDPFSLYRRLRTTSPAPFAAYLEFGNRAVISSSPEEFLRLDGREAVTRPIKGTRPRGATPEEDARLRDELLASAKDDAELVMIVDLERNDLGRVAETGTVRVPRPKELEGHPTVWHLAATVTARVRDGIGPVELLESAFPGGSITGAPKIRAMEIIDDLEPTRRAVFTGSLVWMRPGFLRSSVAIRTMMRHGDLVTFQAGGAIVADSDPAAEHEETLVKARAMAASVGLEGV